MLPLSALLLAASPSPGGEEALAQAIGDRVARPAVSCIDPTDIQSVRIVEGTAIVYGAGNRIFVNRPLSGAASLHRDDTLVTHIEGGQLCRLDSITLADAVSRIPHGFVILGSFVPYERPLRR